MNPQEAADYKKRRFDTTQKLIRVAVNCMTDEKKGRLTTRGVIRTLQEAIDYLEESALHTSPEKYLEKAPCTQVQRNIWRKRPAHKSRELF